MERHLATLVRALPERFTKTVAFLSRGGPIADELAAEGIPIHVLGMRRSYDPLGALRLLRVVRAGDFALVHDHSTMAAAPILALGLARVPLVVTEHLSLAQRRLDQRASYRLLSRFVDCFIANSNATRSELLTLGIPDAKLRLIHHGLLSTPHSAFRIPHSALRSTVGFVGRLEPEKGCRDFVRMASQVAAAVPDARFVIVGDGSQGDRVAADVVAAGLSARVQMLGAVADIDRVYPTLDVLVSTSQRETFGLAILEAMAAGVAVAAFRVGGVTELIAAGAGESVAAGDVTGLANVVIELLRDPGRRQALAARARERVAQRFTATRMADEVAQVYDAVVAGRRV
ncbi:MAG: glycosyltransferase [Deltaproteobacteria bacterium]|nr:glycosyltransferase [Deltaproteobacteria bacterium]